MAPVLIPKNWTVPDGVFRDTFPVGKGAASAIKS